MLDPWIIEQIRRREEEQRRYRDEQPSLEVPADNPPEPAPPGTYGNKDEPERGVAILNY
ncbi:MAG: hypothetical protein RMK29_02140 [Myxococcales bacterium]|nr:hypothetical protein [Myxococcota bacterium]MDW8280480.1 hypothetical protein [Myxococcales bacterium]